MTEREVFEAHGKMMGWDLSKDEDETFICFEVNGIWKGWKLRADMQRAVEAAELNNRLAVIFNPDNEELSKLRKLLETKITGYPKVFTVKDGL